MPRSLKKTDPTNGIAIRLASEADAQAIARLRQISNPDDKRSIDVAETAFGLWWVADDGKIRACVRVFEQLPQSQPRFVTLSRLYDDGTSAGRRFLGDLIEGFVPAAGAISVQLDYRQRAIVPWLERRVLLKPCTVLLFRDTIATGLET